MTKSHQMTSVQQTGMCENLPPSSIVPPTSRRLVGGDCQELPTVKLVLPVKARRAAHESTVTPERVKKHIPKQMLSSHQNCRKTGHRGHDRIRKNHPKGDSIERMINPIVILEILRMSWSKRMWSPWISMIRLLATAYLRPQQTEHLETLRQSRHAGLQNDHQ